MYSVSRKNCAKRAPASSRLLMLDAVSVRSRKICSGSSGAFERASITTKETTSAAEAASSPIVGPVPQPCWVARVRAYTSSTRPPVIVAAPATSKLRCRRSARLSRSRHGVSASTIAPVGTLMKKIHGQLKALVSAPPSRTPAAAPLPAAAPQIPSARLRSRPSLKVVVRIDSAAGEHRGPQALQRAEGDQRSLRPGEAVEERADREERDACDEQAPPPKHVGQAAAEQQDAAEEDRVGGDHPLQALLAEVQVCLDRG